MKADIDIDHNEVSDSARARYELLRDLEYVIRVATGNDRINLIGDRNKVIIDYNNGTYQWANVECDGLLKMAADIMETALHGKFYETKEGFLDDDED